MTYNVFSGALNPAQSITVTNLKCDAGAKPECSATCQRSYLHLCVNCWCIAFSVVLQHGRISPVFCCRHHVWYAGILYMCFQWFAG